MKKNNIENTFYPFIVGNNILYPVTLSYLFYNISTNLPNEIHQLPNLKKSVYLLRETHNSSGFRKLLKFHAKPCFEFFSNLIGYCVSNDVVDISIVKDFMYVLFFTVVWSWFVRLQSNHRTAYI
jgi:hypothetical protein